MIMLGTWNILSLIPEAAREIRTVFGQEFGKLSSIFKSA